MGVIRTGFVEIHSRNQIVFESPEWQQGNNAKLNANQRAPIQANPSLMLARTVSNNLYDFLIRRQVSRVLFPGTCNFTQPTAKGPLVESARQPRRFFGSVAAVHFDCRPLVFFM